MEKINLLQFEKWNQHEKDKLEDLYKKGFSDKEISKVLLRSKEAIEKKRQRLNLLRRDANWLWSDGEVNLLIKLFRDGLIDREISKILKRTISSVRKKRESLGLIKSINYWSNEESDSLIKLFNSGLTDRKMAHILKRTIYSVKEKRRNLELIRKRNYWSDEEIKLLRYLKFEKGELNRTIANKLGRSIGSVKSKLHSVI
jgi:hypothetical protein